jgi:hypothetical protein
MSHEGDIICDGCGQLRPWACGYLNDVQTYEHIHFCWECAKAIREFIDTLRDKMPEKED